MLCITKFYITRGSLHEMEQDLQELIKGHWLTTTTIYQTHVIIAKDSIMRTTMTTIFTKWIYHIKRGRIATVKNSKTMMSLLEKTNFILCVMNILLTYHQQMRSQDMTQKSFGLYSFGSSWRTQRFTNAME